MVRPGGDAQLGFRIGLFQAELSQLDLHVSFIMMIGIIIIVVILRIRLFTIIAILSGPMDQSHRVGLATGRQRRGLCKQKSQFPSGMSAIMIMIVM